MCFCRRKTSSKEEAIETSRRGGVDNSRKMLQEQPQAPHPPQHAPQIGLNKTTDKKGKKAKSTPRDVRISKKKPRKPREDDTISNIPEEMPDLEINREHAEPFYTDEQLM